MNVKCPIVVTRHAVLQAKRRFRDYPTSLRAIEERITAEVAEEIIAGRMLKERPEPFRLFQSRKRRMKPAECFVMSRDGRRGWIIVREGSQDVVLTSLSRAWAEEAIIAP